MFSRSVQKNKDQGPATFFRVTNVPANWDLNLDAEEKKNFPAAPFQPRKHRSRSLIRRFSYKSSYHVTAFGSKPTSTGVTAEDPVKGNSDYQKCLLFSY